MTALDKSLALEPQGQGRWRALADPHYEANTGMFGGWTMALLAKAVLAHPDAQGTLSAATVHYVNRVPPGSFLSVHAQRLGASRSLAYWRCDLSVEGATSGELAATATMVLANRRESDRFTEDQMPGAPPPETIETFHPPGPFGQRIEMRTVLGGPPFNKPSTRSLMWQRETSGRKLDAVQMAFLCDIGPPRVWYLGTAPRPSSTTTMSIYIHATEPELAACGDDFVLSDMIGTRIEHATVGSNAKMWSRGGALLATTEQLCWFR